MWVTFSAGEMQQIQAAAGREAMAGAAWLGMVGIRAATAGGGAPTAAAPPPVDDGGGLVMRELMAGIAELMETRRILRNVGGNLNDVARHANSTGLIAAETRRVLVLVARTVQRVDTVVAGLEGRLGAARRHRQESLRRRRASR
jgi:hypothetical protein